MSVMGDLDSFQWVSSISQARLGVLQHRSGRSTVQCLEQLWSYVVGDSSRLSPRGLLHACCTRFDSITRNRALTRSDAEGLGRFYNCFDAVVLLSAPVDVMLQRIAIRLTNPFGKTAEERRRILADLEAVEPLLRATSTTEIVTTIPVTEVADVLETVAREAQPCPAWGSASDQPELSRACRANEP